MSCSLCLITCLSVLLHAASALDNGLALTPPMGFMSWGRYMCTINCTVPTECISEWLFRQVADLFVSEGYAELGYEYVIVDDCWLSFQRDDEGHLQPDPDRFPSGMKALADYIHAKGLKFGLYEDYGTHTCMGYPGVIDHMEEDVKSFVEWEVDYIKLDGCNADPDTYDQGYPLYGQYLNQSGRPIVYSCSWPAYQETPNYPLISEHCNLWRNTGDIENTWKSVCTIMDWFAYSQDTYAPVAGPGHWNDPDMLVIGNGDLTEGHSRAQMAVWCILAAPLLISTDLANLEPSLKAILQNKAAIDIDQDPLGIQGRQVLRDQGIYSWVRAVSPEVDGKTSFAVAFINRRPEPEPYQYTVNYTDLHVENSSGYCITDIFENSGTEYPNEVDPTTTELTVTIQQEDAVFLYLKLC